MKLTTVRIFSGTGGLDYGIDIGGAWREEASGCCWSLPSWPNRWARLRERLPFSWHLPLPDAAATKCGLRIGIRPSDDLGRGDTGRAVPRPCQFSSVLPCPVPNRPNLQIRV